MKSTVNPLEERQGARRMTLHKTQQQREEIEKALRKAKRQALVVIGTIPYPY